MLISNQGDVFQTLDGYLLIWLFADGEKLFSWPEALTLMDCREDSLKKFVSGMGGVDSASQGPCGVQFLE